MSGSFDVLLNSMLNNSTSSISGILNEINPILGPIISSTSIGSLLVNLLNLPSIIGQIVELFGVNAVYTIIQVAIFTVLENYIHAILNWLDSTFMTSLIDTINVNSIFTSQLLNTLGNSVTLSNSDFINVVNAVLSFLDGLKTSSLIHPIHEGLLNTVFSITMVAK